MSKNLKNNLPLISIIIPSYNKGKYISETINSVINQNYPKIEIIIQDGGSTDNSLDVIKKYAKKYPSIIKWVSQKDNGQCDAINKGMGKAKGELLAYINADDVYEINAFTKVAKVYNDNPKSMWFAGRGRVIDGQGREIVKIVSFFKSLLLKINSYPLLLIVNYLIQPSVFITKQASRNYGKFLGDTFVLEYDMWLKMGKNMMPIVLNDTLSLFRMTQDNITTKQTDKLLDFDYAIAKKYTKNKLILFLHWLSIFGRKLTLKTL